MSNNTNTMEAGAPEGDGNEGFAADLELMRAGHIPPQLSRAAESLVALAADDYEEDSHFTDSFANDTDVNVAACRAAIRLCRVAIEAIEAQAREVLAHEVDYMRGRLAELEGVGQF